MNILVTLCARGGSKGIPDKNIRPLAGRPLIGYTIDAARAFARRHEGVSIELSTDSPRIAQTAAECGLATAYRRPDELATDAAGKIGAIKDVLLWSERERGLRYDYVLDLDVTSPLRTVEDLDRGLRMLEDDPDALNLFSVSPAARNPYFNMVEQKENGYYGTVKPLGDVLSRQAAPKVYDLNASFYFYRRAFFDAGLQGAITDRSLVYEMPHICFDLDHPIDFEFLSFLVAQGKVDITFGL